MIDSRYEAKMFHPLTLAYYGDSYFFNFGYWLPETQSQKEACENLMDLLLDFLPQKQGPVLDVACGMGATTRYLGHYFAPSQVVGINISPRQLQQARRLAPQSSFQVVDAVQPAFKSKAFQVIICVEAAFHFHTRRQFLAQAYRLLQPGGYLLLTDMLFPRWAVRLNRRVPNENWLPDVAAYQQLLTDVGFQPLTVRDITAQSWTPFQEQAARWRLEQRNAGRIGPLAHRSMVWRNNIADRGVQAYLLVAARK